MSEAKVAACDVIDKNRDALREISLDIWNHPEYCFEEHHAHQVLTDFLESRGFQVERKFKLDTAFRATVASPDYEAGSPTIGVMCEYDALEGIGHGCGHNLIATLGLATGLGIKRALDLGQVKGKLVVLGCPAEEGGGGKIDLINSGVYDDMDLAMMGHPSNNNLPQPVYIAIQRISVTYHGKESHASASPWKAINALDAAVLCYQNISCLRHQMKPTWRVHGIITDGGVRTNVIPQKSELSFSARAPTQAELKELKSKLINCFEGSATATGCTVSYEFDSKPYAALVSNATLASLYVTNGQKVGIEFENDPTTATKQGGSTDMGNVSRVLPSIHPKFSLNTSVALHTRDFRDIAKTEASHTITLTHAKALAMAAMDVYKNPELVRKMKEELKHQLKDEQ